MNFSITLPCTAPLAETITEEVELELVEEVLLCVVSFCEILLCVALFSCNDGGLMIMGEIVCNVVSKGA